MFKAVYPVLPTLDMAASLEFWRKLGFRVAFADDPDRPEASAYAGVERDGLYFHLQTFTPEQAGPKRPYSLRIEMESAEALVALAAEWAPLGVITAPLGDRDWGNREFGFYDPDGTAIFFVVFL